MKPNGRQVTDITGNKYGRLTVVSLLPKKEGDKARYWHCMCECGNTTPVSSSKLTTGHTQSCGCLQKERVALAHTTHGLKNKHPKEYGVWLTMRNRCRKPSVKCYGRYGGRGITVAPEWESFEVFIQDMGPRPSDEHSIERKDNDVGYSRENCFWATRVEQANNTRRNHFITIDGVTKTIAQWGRIFNISDKTVQTRIGRGMDAISALTTPLRNRDGSMKC